MAVEGAIDGDGFGAGLAALGSGLASVVVAGCVVVVGFPASVGVVGPALGGVPGLPDVPGGGGTPLVPGTGSAFALGSS